jgi:hypothetical protein
VFGIMPRKRKDLDPADTPDFNLQSPAENSAVPGESKPSKRKQGAFVPLTETGAIDWERVRPSQKEGIEQARRAFASQPEPATGEVQFITEDHVKMALRLFETGCAYAIPELINSRVRTEGGTPIPRELALRVYQLTPEQLDALAPDGAIFANQQFQNLPEWLKQWILAVGPGAKFFGQLSFITAMQTKAMLDEWRRMQPQPVAQPVNGHAVEGPEPTE